MSQASEGKMRWSILEKKKKSPRPIAKKRTWAGRRSGTTLAIVAPPMPKRSRMAIRIDQSKFLKRLPIGSFYSFNVKLRTNTKIARQGLGFDEVLMFSWPLRQSDDYFFVK